MGKLCMTLPPFSPDYSGVCSALFPLNCLTVIHDGSGCTGNYTGYDEPRWFHSNSPIYCSGLREIDAILGDDEKLVQKVLSAMEEVKPEMIALVGSPVPMVIGSDMDGIAADIESRTGIPSFGFSTTGLKYYPQGIEQVDKKVIRRILEESEEIPQKRKNSVNILGATPIDFGKSTTISDMEKLLTENGYDINVTFWSCNGRKEIEESVHAACNIVVSNGGLWLAEYMKKQYGIPYMTGLPYGENYAKIWIDRLEACMKQAERGATETADGGKPGSAGENRVLIIGEQLQSNSLREALQYEYGIRADIAGICGWSHEFAKESDCFLEAESKIEAILNREQYDMIIGDFLYKELLHTEKRWIPYSHYAVSSKLGNGWSYSLIGEKLGQLGIR